MPAAAARNCLSRPTGREARGSAGCLLGLHVLTDLQGTSDTARLQRTTALSFHDRRMSRLLQRQPEEGLFPDLHLHLVLVQGAPHVAPVVGRVLRVGVVVGPVPRPVRALLLPPRRSPVGLDIRRVAGGLRLVLLALRLRSPVVAKPDGDVLHGSLRMADAHVQVVRVALAHAVAQPGLPVEGLPNELLRARPVHRLLEEVGRQPGRRRGVVAWEAEEVDRGHRQEGGVSEEVGVVLHLRRRDQQLARPASLEEAQRVLRRYQAVALAVDEQGGAGDVGDNLAVREALVEGPCYEPSDDALHSRLDRGERGDQDEAPHGILRREESGRPAP
mmetsp:Transcript_54720/g.144167  ORF Transcript_54720/g.144167 Transcript_54720/m.144167 type:complete len:331 (+) Transcript_54720:24-1016(+)